MLKDIIKRFLISIVGIVISAYIWHINRNIFGNTINICLILSIFVFLMVYIPFEAYFSVRKIWYDRWPKLIVNCLKKEKIHIPIESTSKNKRIVANIIKISEKSNKREKNAIIIVNHGYSDTKETLEYLYLPLAMQGYVILVYDARGTGESKDLGKRNQFKKRIEDYRAIVRWIGNHHDYLNHTIYTIGFSIGGITSLAGSFMNQNIEKIIALSCISHYGKTVRRLNPLILISYLLRGIKIFPEQQLIETLSPYLIFKNQKEKLDSTKFNDLSQRVYLIHAKNDRVIRFRNFKENVSILELPQKNQLIFKKGGHTLKKNELALVGGILKFLED